MPHGRRTPPPPPPLTHTHVQPRDQGDQCLRTGALAVAICYLIGWLTFSFGLAGVDIFKVLPILFVPLAAFPVTAVAVALPVRRSMTPVVIVTLLVYCIAIALWMTPIFTRNPVDIGEDCPTSCSVSYEHDAPVVLIGSSLAIAGVLIALCLSARRRITPRLPPSP